MLNYSRKPKIINPNAYKKGRIGILVQNEYEYLRHFNNLIEHHKELIAAVLPDNQPLQFPLGTEYLEAFLSGYKIEFHSFTNHDAPDLEGFRLQDPDDASKIHVYYNTNCSPKRQLYTKVHETMHVCQLLDPYFLDYVDWLLANPNFPKEVVEHYKRDVRQKVKGIQRKAKRNKFGITEA